MILKGILRGLALLVAGFAIGYIAVVWIPGLTKSRTSKAPDISRYEIAFVRDGDICISTTDGQDIMRLTDDGGRAFPIWSPDGRQIACLKNESPNGSSLWIVSPTDKKSKRIVTADGAALYPVAWLPDMTGIICDRVALGKGYSEVGLEVIYLSGKPESDNPVIRWNEAASRQWENWRAFVKTVAFSPSFDEVILLGETKAGSRGLYRIDEDGTNLRQIDSNGLITCLKWHPSEDRFLATGVWHVEVSSLNGGAIWIFGSDGNVPTVLKERIVPSRSGIGWSPDGESIICQIPDGKYPANELPEQFDDLSSHSSIWLIKADGTNRQKIIENACHPDWR